MEKVLIFVHGFLGCANDWQPVLRNLSTTTENYCLDLSTDFEVADMSFSTWPKAFENWLKRKSIKSEFALIGYSLGGRLTLPLLESGFSRTAVFLSSHFGLPENAIEDRHQRNQLNHGWSQKFLFEDWTRVIHDWNRQDVFEGSTGEIQRIEQNYNRELLARQLTGFSLGVQKEYSFLLERQNFRGLYLAGDKDLKYSALARQLAVQHPTLDVRFIKNAGHRLLFDQPLSVAREISDFFNG